MLTKQQKITAFVSKIAKAEGGASEARIGDIRQIVRLINKELDGALYLMIDGADGGKEEPSDDVEGISDADGEGQEVA